MSNTDNICYHSADCLIHPDSIATRFRVIPAKLILSAFQVMSHRKEVKDDSDENFPPPIFIAQR